MAPVRPVIYLCRQKHVLLAVLHGLERYISFIVFDILRDRNLCRTLCHCSQSGLQQNGIMTGSN